MPFENIVVTGIFSSFHNVFYSTKKKIIILATFIYLSSANTFSWFSLKFCHVVKI